MSNAVTGTKPTRLKLPASIKTQLEEDAQKAGLSLHAFMVQTLADSVRRTRQREAFARATTAALSNMKTSGLRAKPQTLHQHAWADFDDG